MLIKNQKFYAKYSAYGKEDSSDENGDTDIA